MKISPIIIVSALVLLSCSLFLTPCVLAQSSLDEIKAKLESEGISVVDYSTREGQWGSLPTDMIQYLVTKGFTDLSDLISKGNLTQYFISEEPDDISLTTLRRELAKLISEKSQLTIQNDINAKDKEILALQDEVKSKEEDAKNSIGTLIESTDQAAKNLIFNEVDFYFNYSKWGRLPTRIIAFLESNNYSGLQALVDEQTAAEADENILFSDLSTTLAELTMTDEEGETIRLSQDDIDLIMDSMAILSASGERQIGEVARSVVDAVKNFVAGLAVIWIIYAGARMILAQGEESVITEQKKAMFYGLLGLVAILLVGRGIDFLYGPAGVTRTELVRDVGFSAEVYGVISFLKAMIGIIAILFIIFSGIRMMFAAGEESEITKQKTALLWVGVGLILVAINEVVVRNLFIIPTEQSDQIRTSNVTALINTIGSVLQLILGFVGLVAFGVLIYGAASLVANYGEEEMVTRAHKIIKNAIYGILVIVSAYTLVATLVIFR